MPITQTAQLCYLTVNSAVAPTTKEANVLLRYECASNMENKAILQKVCTFPKNTYRRSTATMVQNQDFSNESSEDNLQIATFASSTSLETDKVNVSVLLTVFWPVVSWVMERKTIILILNFVAMLN